MNTLIKKFGLVTLTSEAFLPSISQASTNFTDGGWHLGDGTSISKFAKSMTGASMEVVAGQIYTLNDLGNTYFTSAYFHADKLFLPQNKFITAVSIGPEVSYSQTQGNGHSLLDGLPTQDDWTYKILVSVLMVKRILPQMIDLCSLM